MRMKHSQDAAGNTWTLLIDDEGAETLVCGDCATLSNEELQRLVCSDCATLSNEELQRREEEKPKVEKQFSAELLGKHLPNRYSWLQSVRPILEHIDSRFDAEGLVHILLDHSNHVMWANVRVGEASRVEYSMDQLLDAAARPDAAKLVAAHSHPRYTGPAPSDMDVEAAAALYLNLRLVEVELSEDLVFCRTLPGTQRELKSVLATRRFKRLIAEY